MLLEMTDPLMCLWVVVCTVSVGSPQPLAPPLPCIAPLTYYYSYNVSVKLNLQLPPPPPPHPPWVTLGNVIYYCAWVEEEVGNACLPLLGLAIKSMF